MAYLNPWKEVAVDRSGKRPADVFIPAWSRGRSLAIDVPATHFSQSSITQMVDGGSSASVCAALAKVEAKDRLYKALCEQQGVDFLALPVCCYGGWLSSGAEVVQRLAACMAERSGQSRGLVT